jgi:hypothetical protein
MTKTILTAVLVLLSTAAMAQVANIRDGNGNLIRRGAPINNAQPMINSRVNNPARPVQNLAPTSDDVSRSIHGRK